MSLYNDSTNSPFIHLVDGSASDNLGLRCYLDVSSILQANPALLARLGKKGTIKKVVLISVNSFVHPETGWDRQEAPPSSKKVAAAAGYRTMERYSEDTLVDTRRLIRDLKLRLEEKEEIQLYQIELDFMKVKDPSRMRKLLSLPTTFSLHRDVVRELEETARTLLYANKDFLRLVDDLDATYPEKIGPE
jgi:NTE family protein